jgi:hypothetical protein
MSQMTDRANKAFQEWKAGFPSLIFTTKEELAFKSGFLLGVRGELDESEAKAMQAVTLGTLVGFAIGVKS